MVAEVKELEINSLIFQTEKLELIKPDTQYND